MATIRHVLAAVDLAQDVPLSLTAAQEIAAVSHARLTVLHASKSAVDDAHRTALLGQLSDLVAAHGAARPATDLVVHAGDPAREVVSFAAAHDVDLVVIGQRPRGTLQRLFFESVGEAVVARASSPVLVVPALGPGAAPPAVWLPSRILCAVDLSDGSSATLATAAAFARSTRAALSVLHVVESWYEPDAPTDPLDEFSLQGRSAASARERLALLVDPFRGDGLNVQLLVSFGVAPLEIVHAVARAGADVLVTGSHPRRRLGEVVPSRIARYLLGDPPCSLLLAGPQRARMTTRERPVLEVVSRH